MNIRCFASKNRSGKENESNWRLSVPLCTEAACQASIRA